VPVEHAVGKPWAPRLAAETPPPPPSSMPVFIAQGTRDDVVPASTTALLQRQWCRAGSHLEVDWLEGIAHNGAIDVASRSAVSWIEQRLRGSPAPTDCSTEPPVTVSPA